MDAGQCPDSGSFLESVDFDGQPRPSDQRRVRVQFRQIYAASYGFHMGFAPDGLDCARQAFDFVWNNAWATDQRPGWAHVLDQSGAVIDPSRDAYDHAFALFGLGWYHRVSGDPRALLAIRQTLSFMERALRAGNGGWIESDQSFAKRRQNPHMHWFEATMALYETTGERPHLARASEQFALFSSHFFDPDNAVVLEYFDHDWRPLTEAEGQRVEPGHMAEWVWLLREFQRLTGKPIDDYANALFERVLEIGFDQSGRFLVDELTPSGVCSKPTRRLWPQTELLRAAVAQHRANGDPAALALAEKVLNAIFDDYLGGCIKGGWRDQFSLDGAPLADRMPASSFYHLLCAFSAVIDLYGDRGDKVLRA